MGTGIPKMELDCHSLVMITKLVRLVVLRELKYVSSRADTPTGLTGIYRCDIPTIAVHDNTDISVRSGRHSLCGSLY